MEKLEARHICPERALAELMELEKAVVSRAQRN
jgi:hypothetical protein